jgi:hypothetical protein
LQPLRTRHLYIPGHQRCETKAAMPRIKDTESAVFITEALPTLWGGIMTRSGQAEQLAQFLAPMLPDACSDHAGSHFGGSAALSR